MTARFDPRARLPIERLTRARCRAVKGRTQIQLTRLGPVHDLAVYCAAPVADGGAYCPACAAGLRLPGAAPPRPPAEGLRRPADADRERDLVEMTEDGR